jgi:ACS family hexuronate transporter-like MFS transporter
VVSRRAAWAVTIVAMLTMTVSLSDRQTLAVLAPSVTKAMGISESAYGWLTAAFSAAYLIATPVSGRWIDGIGARRGLVYSVLAWSTVAALHALAPGFAFLFALRIALGMAEGPSFPGAAQAMQRVLPPRDRSRGFGMLFTGSSVGAMIAPPLASFLFRLAGWRVAFLGTALVGLLWGPLWIAITRRPGVAVELDAAAPVTAGEPRPGFRALVSSPITVRALLGIAAVAPINGFLAAWASKFLVQRFGLTQGEVGSYLWLPPLGLDVAALLFGDLVARQRREPGAPARGLFVVATLLSASVALFPLVGTPWQSMVVAALAVGGGAAVYTIVTSDMLGRMPLRSVSSAAGILAGAQSLALIISGPLIGRALDHFGDYRVISTALAVWVLPGSLAWWWWRPPKEFAARTA